MSILTRMFKRHPAQQYIVWRKSGNVSVRGELSHYSGVRILNEANPRRALVEMSDDVRDRIAHEHPELSIEPNALYKLQT